MQRVALVVGQVQSLHHTTFSRAHRRFQNGHHRQRFHRRHRIGDLALQRIADQHIVLALIALRGSLRVGLQRGIIDNQRVVILAPVGAARYHARQQLALLLVGPRFDNATFIAVHGEARRAARDQHAAVQDHFMRRVV